MCCFSVKCCVFVILVLYVNNKLMVKDNVDFFIIYVFWNKGGFMFFKRNMYIEKYKVCIFEFLI